MAKGRYRNTEARKTVGYWNGILWPQEIGKQRNLKRYIQNTNQKYYSVPGWRIMENNKKVEYVEMDALSRSLWISRRDRIRSEETQRWMGVEENLTKAIKSKKLVWLAHV